MANLIRTPGQKELVFPPYVLDLENNRLFSDGEIVVLESRELEVLTLLMEKAGTTVTTDELMSKIYEWERTEGALHQAISGLRDKLGDRRRKTLIKTDRINNGYRFDPDAAECG